MEQKTLFLWGAGGCSLSWGKWHSDPDLAVGGWFSMTLQRHNSRARGGVCHRTKSGDNIVLQVAIPWDPHTLPVPPGVSILGSLRLLKHFTKVEMGCLYSTSVLADRWKQLALYLQSHVFGSSSQS